MGTEADGRDKAARLPEPPAGEVEALDPILRQVQAEFEWMMDAFDSFRDSLGDMGSTDSGTPGGYAQP